MSGVATAKKPRRRLDPQERESQIVQRAIKYFAEVGFTAGTRELAKQIGVAQSLLYHYFPNKETLLEKVFDELYARPWKPDWDALLADRSITLAERLTSFYIDYANTVHTHDGVRVFFFAGLRDVGIHRWNLMAVRTKIYTRVISELRHESGLAPKANRRLSAFEDELAWQLHGAIFYLGIRRYILNLPPSVPFEEAVETAVSVFLEGARKFLLAKGQKKKVRLAG